VDPCGGVRDSELTIRVGRSVGAIDLMSDEVMRGVGRAAGRDRAKAREVSGQPPTVRARTSRVCFGPESH